MYRKVQILFLLLLSFLAVDLEGSDGKLLDKKEVGISLGVGNSAGGGLTKYGQPFDEIGEVLENGVVRGKYSTRTFRPDKAGGIIRNLDWKTASITEEGIRKVEIHLARFGPIDQNQKAIQRLKDIKAGKVQISDYDKRFYTHELDEYDRFKEIGIPDDVHDQNYYNPAHSAALEDYRINAREVDVYHPDTESTIDELLKENRALDKWIDRKVSEGKYIMEDGRFREWK